MTASGRCTSADAPAVFAEALELALLRVVDAAVPATGDGTFFGKTWDTALPAPDFVGSGDLGDAKTREAEVAARAELERDASSLKGAPADERLIGQAEERVVTPEADNTEPLERLARLRTVTL